MRNSLLLVLAVFFAGVSSAVAQESKLTEQQKSQLIKRFPKSDANKDGELRTAKSQETKAYEADTSVYGGTDSEITATGERDRPLLGVQRWDMFSGKGATQQKELGYLPGKQGFLKDSQWHDRVPFFCRLTKDVDWIEHPANAGPLWFNYPFSQQLLQESMDQELRYACNAGIDFFVYHGPARKLYANGWELRNNFDCHLSSKIPEAKKVNFTWALYAHRAIRYTRSKVATMMDETIEYIKMPNWQTVMDGRPLIVVYHPERFRSALQVAQGKEHMTGAEFVEYVRTRVEAAGLKTPYIVGCMEPRDSFMHAKILKEEGYDAFMDYEGAYGGAVAKRDEAPTYAAATEEILKTCEQEYLNRGLPFLPPCPSMHYRWPHAFDRKGQAIEELHHFQWPKEGDLEARVEAVLDFVATHPEDCEAQTVIMYSWNEHSGGGGICPTMGKSPEYKPVTQWLDEVAEALAAWKYPQESELSEEQKSKLIKRFPRSDANKDGKLDDAELRALRDFIEARRNNAPRNKTPSTPASDAKPHADTDKWKTVGLQQANTMGGGEAAIPKDGKFRVFLLMGQSNMHGTARAKELKAPYTEKHDRIRVWANGRWEYFVPRQRFGPGVSFAHQLAEFWPNDTIGIIKVSSGGTGIRGFEKNWSFERANLTFDGKKGSLYKDLMNAVAEANKISKPEFCGFVWKQGAADGTKKVLANDYYDTFKQLVSDLRADLSAPDLPVFVPSYMNDDDLLKAITSQISDEDLRKIKNLAGNDSAKNDELLEAVLVHLNEASVAKLRKTAFGKRPYIAAVIAAQNRASRDIANVATIYPGTLPKGADGTHYTAEGYITLGKFTASAVQEFYKDEKSAAKPVPNDR